MKVLGSNTKLVTVTLGDFSFMNMEVPEKIPLGGEQILAIQKFIGGGRNVDALGPDERDLEWSGLFWGANALDRAMYLDTLRRRGKPLALKWSTLSFMVMISKFHFEYKREFQIPYQIVCVVVSNNNALSDTFNEEENWDTAIRDDLSAAFDCVDNMVEVEIPTSSVTFDSPRPKTFLQSLRDKMNSLKASTTQVNNFMRASSAQINTVKSDIKSAQSDVTTQMASVGNYLQTVSTVGGVFPNNPIARSTKNMTSVVVNHNNTIQLNNLQYLLARTQKNLAKVQPVSSTSTIATSKNIALPTFSLPIQITVQNTDLYRVASKYYGNAMKWNIIANANNLTSPYINSAMTIIIPRDSDSTGGLNAR